MHEHVASAFGFDKAKAFSLIEPFNFVLHRRLHPPFLDFLRTDFYDGIKKPPHFEECGG
jgi:hypothetical protein